jgi:folate-binding protein YgfZ
VAAVRDAGDAVNASPEAYDAHRIGLGVPEGGRDFVFGDTFPHEALLDQLNGVSFDKGCYVGQEVVSRMQHRTTVRKRVVPVEADQELPQGPLPVLVGEAEIGRLGSVAGQRGLALLRLDRVAEAQRGGTLVTVNGLPLRVVLPSFATFQLGAPHEIA